MRKPSQASGVPRRSAPARAASCTARDGRSCPRSQLSKRVAEASGVTGTPWRWSSSARATPRWSCQPIAGARSRPLREAWPRRCDLVLHTGDQPAFPGFRARRALADAAVDRDGNKVALATLAGRRIVAVAAIAKPQGFFDMLQAAGITAEDCKALPDHHDFKDWTPPPAGTTVLCTEKDAVKLWQHRPDAWAVPLEVTLEPGLLRAFDALVDAKLSLPHGPETA